MELEIVVKNCLILAITLWSRAAAEINCNAHPDPLNPHSCCPIPDLITDDIKEKCGEFIAILPPMFAKDENFNSNDISPHPHLRRNPHKPCLMSCLFNETGILNDEQQLNEERLNDYLVLALADSNEELFSILQDSFKTCAARADEIHANIMAERFRPRPMFSSPCSLKAGLLAGCVFMETFQNCPSSLWNDSEQCIELRDFMKVCKPPRGRWYKKHFNGSSSKDTNA